MVTVSFVECLIAVEIPIDENCQNCQMLKLGCLQKRDPQTPCVPTSWLEKDLKFLQKETFTVEV